MMRHHQRGRTRRARRSIPRKCKVVTIASDIESTRTGGSSAGVATVGARRGLIKEIGRQWSSRGDQSKSTQGTNNNPLFTISQVQATSSSKMYIEDSNTTTIHSQGQGEFRHKCKAADYDTIMRIKQLRQPASQASQQSLEEGPEEACKRLCSAIRTGAGRLSQSAILDLAKLLKEAPAQTFCQDAVKTVVIYFNKLAHRLQDEQEHDWQPETSTQYLMMQALSVLSQLITDKVLGEAAFPFSRSFLNNVFMVSAQLVEVSKTRKQIVRILSVLLLELSTQSKLLHELNMFGRYRQTLLSLYRFSEDSNTFNRMNRALRCVIVQAPLSLVEVRRYKLLETVGRFASSKNFVEVLAKLNLCRFLEKVTKRDPYPIELVGEADT